jgi:hypothetical protein
MGKNTGISCAERQRRKGGAKRPKGGVAKRPMGDLRHELDLDKDRHMPITPPAWQVFYHGKEFIMLVNMLNKCKVASIIDGSNQPPPIKRPTRVTVIIVSPTSVVRWASWFSRPDVFFFMVENPKEEDPAIGDLLRCLRNVKVYVHTGDTKEGEITIGAKNAAINGCNVVFFSKADNSPKPKNNKVNRFHCSLHNEIKTANTVGGVDIVGFSALTPRA